MYNFWYPHGIVIVQETTTIKSIMHAVELQRENAICYFILFFVLLSTIFKRTRWMFIQLLREFHPDNKTVRT